MNAARTPFLKSCPERALTWANTPKIMIAAQQVALIAQARLMLRSNAGSRPTLAIPMHQASRNASWIREIRPPPTLMYACE